MNKHQKYKKWVVDDLLKNTLVETYSTTINFTTPKGILQRRDDVSFYDETIQVYYGIPDDYSIISEIENAYREILVDMYYEYDMWPVKFKDGESVYDYLQRTKKPLSESLSDEEKSHERVLRGKEKYKEYVAGKLLKKVNFQDGYMYFPWILSSLAHHYSSANTLFPFNKEEVRNLGPYKDVHFDDDEMFNSYVRDRYGVKENEAHSIWLRLKKRLLDLAPEIN